MSRSSAVSEDDARVSLGARIREMRRSRGVTLRDLAARLDVSPATMSAVENGRTGLSAVRLVQLSEVLDAPVGQLLKPPGSPVIDADGAATSDGHGPRLDWRAYDDDVTLPPPLNAALAAFLEIGYHGATMRDIARRAGLSVPGIYHHYASKQEMLAAVLDIALQDVLVRCRAARAEGATSFERFRNLIECIALFHTNRPDLGFVGTSELRGLEPAGRTRHAAMRREVQQLVDDEVEQGAAEGVFDVDAPREAARAAVNMCTSLSTWFWSASTGRSSPEEVAEQYVKFALRLVGFTERPEPTGDETRTAASRARTLPVAR